MKGERAGFHCISRCVAGQPLLDKDSQAVFVSMLWKLAGFCGIEVVTYCVMVNHVHILIRIPEPPPLSDEQLLERLEVLYGKQGVLTRLARQGLTDQGRIYENVRKRLLERMGDVSAFMKELKQRFSRWYNRRHNRFGTLWAERFKSVVVEDTYKSMGAVAAYIDLNPVRAGLVTDPKDYRFCGYAAALGGKALARKVLMNILEGGNWKECAAGYRMQLFVVGGETKQQGKVVLERERIREVLKQGGRLSLPEVLRLRVRHLSDGVAFGSKEFVNEVFRLHRERFGAKRKDGARPIRALGAVGLTALRDLRVQAIE